MTTQSFERAVRRLTERANRAFGEEVARLREDAGITRLQLAKAAGLNDSFLAKIAAGIAQPSTETSVRIALALGADFARRIYPTTGPGDQGPPPGADRRGVAVDRPSSVEQVP